MPSKPELLGAQQFIAPPAQVPTGQPLTKAASNWANSAYAELIASTPNAIILTGIMVQTRSTNSSCGFEVDIAIGSAGSEVVIATFTGVLVESASLYRSPEVILHCPIPIDAIPAGSRVSARYRQGDTTTFGAWVKMHYVNKPISNSNITTTTQALKPLPAASNLSLSTPASAWADTGWTQLRAAAGPAILVSQINFYVPANIEGELDLGIGGAGAEVVITTIRAYGGSNGVPNQATLFNPLDAIPLNSRIAVRGRCSSASAQTLRASLSYYEKPI